MLKSARTKILLAVVLSAALFAFTDVTDRYFDIARSLDIFTTLFKEVNAHYVDEVDPGELVSNGIKGMLESLDPYTVYIPEDEAEAFSIQTTGQYAGIGALIGLVDSKVLITEPYPGFPADLAGIEVGDELLSVDDKNVEGKNTSEVSALLKGKPKTKVKVTVRKRGSDRQVVYNLTRERIKISNVVYSNLVGKEVGYIKLDDFTPGASKEVEQAVHALKDKGATRFIIDLRDNPGGLLFEAVNIVNLFIPKGLEVVSTKGKLKDWNKTYYTLNNPIDTTTPIAILTSSGSASASEIVAGALQDYDRAVLVGEQTFGKGLVQTTRQLPYNAQVKVTTAKYYIPSGRCIQALDYAHRDENGGVERFPDSLRSEFRTKGGRKVYDGAGLEPDVTVDREHLSAVLYELFSAGLIFEYANVYCGENPRPESMKGFRLSEKDYEDFIAWIKKKKFTYSSPLQRQVDEFISESKQERIYESLKENIAELQQQISQNQAHDFEKFKPEISRALEEEIAFHFHLNAGRVEVSIDRDKDIMEATDLLREAPRYQQLLSSNR
ncbi:MAG: S41 family peptidase [Cyclobacteriaceae bacterium]